MDVRQYYTRVLPRLEACFRPFHYVVGSGNELLAEGWDPALPVEVAPVEDLARLTVGKGLQVHLPVIGRDSGCVLMPLDIDVFLGGDTGLLYRDRASHRDWFFKGLPVVRFVERELRRFGIAHVLDFSPSGAHFLWLNRAGSPAARALASIGFVEDDLARACRRRDPGDIKRRFGVSPEAAAVFSGLGKLAEFLGLRALTQIDGGDLPVALGDSLERCVNFDVSWAEGSPFMRSLRSPYSLHRKNRDRHGFADAPALVDVVGSWFDGERAIEEPDIERVLGVMWDLEAAAEHAERFPEEIPEAGENVEGLVGAYRDSPLAGFHAAFESEALPPVGEAVAAVRREAGLSGDSRALLAVPNPAALQPLRLRAFVKDLTLGAGWAPRRVAGVLRDLYADPAHRWHIDFEKNPPEEKADFWTRVFAAQALTEAGRLGV